MSDDLARIFSLVTPTCKDIHKSTRFVKEGAAKWVNAKAPKEPSNVYLFLISHALLLCEPQADGKYKLIFFINLKADLRVPDDENPLYYNVVSPKKPFQFEAANEQDRVEWQTALRFTLEGLPLPIFREVDGQRVWDPIASLTAEQVSILDDFRTQVHAHLAAADPPYPQEIHDFANDATLLRFLRARQWTVAKSLLMITGTFKWRSEYKPQQIRLAEIEREIVSGKLYISERRDKIGRPVVYYKTRIDDTAHDDVRVRNMVWLLEELTRRMDTPHTGCERSVWLVDFEHADFNSGKLKSQMDVSIDIIKIMQAHYPESLGKCFLIEAPLLFKTIWAAVTPFIDQVTQRKVNFIEKKKAIRDGLLMEYFDKDNLETEFGGSFENPWDFERWKSNLLPNSFPSESTPE